MGSGRADLGPGAAFAVVLLDGVSHVAGRDPPVVQGATGLDRVPQNWTGYHRIRQGTTESDRVPQHWTGIIELDRVPQKWTGYHRIGQGTTELDREYHRRRPSRPPKGTAAADLKGDQNAAD